MTRVLTLARDLATTLTTLAPTLPGAPAGLVVRRSYQPVFAANDFGDPTLHVVAGGIEVIADETDSCGMSLACDVALVFGQRLSMAPPSWDAGAAAELDGILEWVETLIEAVVETEIDEWGRPTTIELLGPGPTPLYLWDWLRDSAVWCTVIGARW